jgi:proteasome activator subunit 4
MASDNNLQKPNIYNKFSPFDEFINEQSSMLFDEIRENLSHTIQLGELEPGFTIWSYKLKRFLALYGFNFTKVDHLKLINLYLSILSITNLNYLSVEICFDMLYGLMRFVFDFFSNSIQI